jgi:alpha-methylacyl-CoA racemase
VLSMTEAAEHPHNKTRGTFSEVDGLLQPSPAPRFSRTSPELTHGSRMAGEDTADVLKAVGYSDENIAALVESGAVALVKN